MSPLPFAFFTFYVFRIILISFVFLLFTLAPVINITEAGRDAAENGRELRLELQSDSKVC